ncbi:hypothetical protein BSP38_026 [Bacillus phage BSP38]|uniref:Uncharacterized protein n=1 Tax=Bacillus phage BSP38 TaxID=2283013 RepID=A0A345MJN6_BPBSP|nr:hypothetical protein HWB82_gp026 [Bacillus phage BSP38]AXH71068.1 hypothetical protein BSP38_026 [Bacillus phage BSP38]
MLVLNKRQAAAFEGLMQKGPDLALEVVFNKIVSKQSWGKIKLYDSEMERIDLTPLEWVSNIVLIKAVVTGEYELEDPRWVDAKDMGEAVYELAQGRPARSMLDPDRKYAVYNTLSDLREMEYVERTLKWQYLEEEKGDK